MPLVADALPKPEWQSRGGMGRRWTKAEDQIVLSNPSTESARLLKRTRLAVELRRSRLGAIHSARHRPASRLVTTNRSDLAKARLFVLPDELHTREST